MKDYPRGCQARTATRYLSQDTPKENVAWLDHLERPELRRRLFYGGARSRQD